jgi:dihydroorotase (multifunctional complex type)
MSVDFLIKDAKIVSPRAIIPGTVAVKGGKIAAIYTNDDFLPEANQIFEASGKYLIPGAIDLHVHFREPGLVYKEDFTTGSQAAAAGGVTTVYDMPNNEPVTITVEAFNNKCAIAAEKSYVNYAFYTYLAQGMEKNIEALIEAGIGGVKWDHDSGKMISPKGYGSWEVYELADNGDALAMFRIIARHDLVIGVHAEDMEIVKRLKRELQEAGRTDFRAHLDSRPDFVEVMGMERAMRLAEISGCRIHIHHISSRAGLQLLKERRDKGLNITCEAAPPWMFFSADDYDRMGGLIKVDPAVKEKFDADALWEGLCDGSVDCYATDHAPHSREEKIGTNWADCLPGAIGVETSIPLLLDRVNKSEITIERVVEVACENPARIQRIYPRKGTISVGADADLVLLDMEKKWTIRNEEVHSKTKVTAFDGWEVQGMPELVFVNGNLVSKNRKIVGQPGIGKLVNPKQAW